ncbi:MAG: SH3 domain-containing protein [Spirochaetales bacterium]|nr:SH3 domain-containing protein [Spirochaetales bacterium]
MRYSLFLIALIACSQQSQKEGDLRFVSAHGGLNLRAQPSTTAEVLIQIPDASVVRVQSGAAVQPNGPVEYGPWAAIEYQGRQGWVSDRFLSAKAYTLDCIKEFRFPVGAAANGKTWTVAFACGKGHQELIENAYRYYRAWWTDHAGENLSDSTRKPHRQIIAEIARDVVIDSTSESVALIQRSSTALDFATFTRVSDIWIFKENFWQPFEHPYGWGHSVLTDINQDAIADAVTTYSCCGHSTIKVFIGAKDAAEPLHMIFEASFSEWDLVLSKGHCNQFQLHGRNSKSNEPEHYSLDCSKNSMVPVKNQK